MPCLRIFSDPSTRLAELLDDEPRVKDPWRKISLKLTMANNLSVDVVLDSLFVSVFFCQYTRVYYSIFVAEFFQEARLILYNRINAVIPGPIREENF